MDETKYSTYMGEWGCCFLSTKSLNWVNASKTIGVKMWDINSHIDMSRKSVLVPGPVVKSFSKLVIVEPKLINSLSLKT